MKIMESVPLINEDKVVFGARDLKLTLDTETGRIAIDAPAMFTDPIVSIHTFEEKIDNLKEHMSRADS